MIPPLVTALFEASQESLAQLRSEVSGMRYGKLGTILFEFRGQTYSMPEHATLLIGFSVDGDKKLAVRALLDRQALPISQELTK